MNYKKLKNLISFKLFESKDNDFPSSFIDDVKDVSLELIDIDLEVDYNFVDYYKTDSLGRPSGKFIKSFAIDIKDVSSRFFRWSEIKETVLRIQDISSRLGFKIDIEVPSDDDYLELNDFISIYSGEELYDISIIIYK
jgi:hypothetical protein